MPRDSAAAGGTPAFVIMTLMSLLRHQSHDHGRWPPSAASGFATPPSSVTPIPRVPRPPATHFVIMGMWSLQRRHFHDHDDLSRLSVASVGDSPGLSHPKP